MMMHQMSDYISLNKILGWKEHISLCPRCALPWGFDMTGLLLNFTEEKCFVYICQQKLLPKSMEPDFDQIVVCD
jgi:hypothetical protein